MIRAFRLLSHRSGRGARPLTWLSLQELLTRTLGTGLLENMILRVEPCNNELQYDRDIGLVWERNSNGTVPQIR